MLLNILFYAVLALSVLVVVAWVANKFMRMWQAGVLMGGVFALAVLVLLAQMIFYIVTGFTMTMSGLFSIFAFVLALCACYMHFRLTGTVIAPIAAIVIALAEVAPRYLPPLPALMPLVHTSSEPWMTSALVLAAVGLGVAMAYAILGAISFVRVHRLNEETNEFIASITLKMPKMVSHFGWWSLVILSFAVGAYMLWCHTIFGAYWIWQPFFAVIAVVWLLVFIAKDVLMMR